MVPFSALKNVEEEQARLVDGIEANRVALEDTDAKLDVLHRNMAGLDRSMVLFFFIVI